MALALTGCGTRFVYNRLDFLTHYYLANQVTLDDSQSRALQSDVDDFFAWHRRSELPRYAGFLDRAASDAVRPVSVSQFAAGRREVETFMQTAVSHAAPDAARWLNGLRPAQLDELFASFAEKERKARAEACDGSRTKRRDKATGKFVENAEQWTGKLSRQQRQLIVSSLAAMESDDCDELDVRAQARLEFRALVDRYRNRPEFADRIAAFLAHPEQRGDADYRRARAADRARFLTLLADLNHSLTPAQREHTVEKLRSTASEIRGLAAQT
ncbi:MAG TPA: DUF6279 family lipoprotein [Steroidobacteraceae bacterium]|nr:DUF6279 family lipoprotein [Steroidobacteraceae bacterium]